MWWRRAWAAKSKLARQRCVVGYLCYTPAMTQEEFNSLAIFVAVVEELRREPFFSEDRHDTVRGDNTAVFCHPMFLKSAVLPFRKIWMEREQCAFRKRDGTGGIRDLVFREFPDRAYADAFRDRYYAMFEGQLKTPIGNGWATESKWQIVNLWLNTQLAHTGPKDPVKKKSWESDMADFNACDARIGREKFEFLFRASVGTVGSYYIEFEEMLAFPLFKKLRNEQGMKPSFEAYIALKYSAHPDPKYKIIFEDTFWHMNRETMKDSFFRLLARQRFDALKDFLRPLFAKVEDAIDFVAKCETLDALLKEANVTILGENQSPDTMLKAHCDKNTFLETGIRPKRIKLAVFADRKIRFYNDTQNVLSGVYIEFVAALKQARQRQRQPDKW
jgi:hypothetical protein